MRRSRGTKKGSQTRDLLLQNGRERIIAQKKDREHREKGMCFISARSYREKREERGVGVRPNKRDRK